MCHRVRHFVTRILRARDTIVYNRCGATHAARDRITGLCTVAERTIIAIRIDWKMCHRVRHFVTRILRARDTIVYNRCGATHTARDRITGLCTVAERAIITIRVDWKMCHRVRHFVTRILRARDTVVYNRCGATHTARGRIAGLCAVAEYTITTGTIVRRVYHRISGFITFVESTTNSIS
jgi:hypothetical protein